MALYESYIIGNNTSNQCNTSNDKLGQTFTPSIGHTVTEVKIRMFKFGNPGTINIGIYAVDGSNLPTDAALATGTTDGDTLTTSGTGEWRTISLGSGTPLTANIQYAIVMDVPGSGSGPSRIIYWQSDSAGATYAGGNVVIALNGAAWSAAGADNDAMFEESGDLVVANNPPSASNVSFTKRLVVAGNNELWYESPAGTKIALSDASGDMDLTLGFDMFEAYGKAFIVNKTNLKVADFINVKIATASLGSNPPDFKTVLTGGSSGAKMVVDYITALSSATTLYGKRITTATFTTGETVTGTDDDGNAISFAMTAVNEVAGPHWYDWTVYGNDSSYGVMPSQATLGSLYRGRAQLSGDVDYPHQWYQSRQGNPWDWNYVAKDAQAPIRGGDSDAGEIGDLIVATIPYKDDYMIHGCANTLWYLVGDAAESGSILELSLTAGILGAKAWCWDRDENLYILATSGLLQIPPGFGPPKNLTEQTYPDFVKDIAYDKSTDRITMAYDRDNHGIHIFNTILTTGVSENWWYDLRTGGLFKDTLPEECGVYSAFFYEAENPTFRKLLFG